MPAPTPTGPRGETPSPAGLLAAVADLAPPCPDGVATPAVVVDVGRMEANIAAWSAAVAARGASLRPHTKTSKCLPVVARQVAAGAAGLCVATLSEAETLADAGYTDIFQAYPLWAGHPAVAGRLRALAGRVQLRVGVESEEAVAALAAVVGDPDQLAVLVEVDSGQHRSGVHPDAAGDVAGAARRAGLRVVGVFTHGGHAYNPAASDPTGDEERALVAAARSVERATGADVAVLSAGATPTTARRQHVGAITEERPGTYVFGDAQQLALGAIGPDGVALTVTTTVVAVHDGGRRVIVDAGSKVLGEAVTPNTASRGLVAGRPDGAVVALSEHHGTLQVPGGGIRVGDRLALVPNHACITVNLVDDLVAVHGDGTTERWPVAGRGKNT